MEFFGETFSIQGFMPHGHCYLWQPALLWLQVISNGLIGLSYVSISLTLVYLVLRIRDIPFQWIYLAFGIFIVTCGVTHFMDIWVIWKPYYWTDGVIRGITAAASVGTAIILPFLVPKAVALAQGAQKAHEKGIRLETAYQQLGEVFEKTKEIDELKTNFFANVSHELRTPLALILGPAQNLLEADNLTPEQRQDLNVVTKNAKLLLKHVNNLLDLSKLEAEKLAPNYERGDLAQMVKITADYFEGVAREKNISFEVKTPEACPAFFDPKFIERALSNLLSNAFKFTPESGKIRLELKEEKGEAIIIVQDSGSGISDKNKEIIFERFRQVDESSTRKHEGTGLGLPIAKEFIDLHQGSISVQDAPQGGALFVVRLPLSPPENVNASKAPLQDFQLGASAKEEVEHLKTKRPEEKAAEQKEESKKGKILVVEDNTEMGDFVANILSVHYQVLRAYNGEEGLQKAKSDFPDLILSDIMMPHMSGDQMVRVIRGDASLQNIPIILLSAKANEDLRAELLKSGAQDYILKPFSKEELLARVKNLIVIKQARDRLQKELETQIQDLDSLTGEVVHSRAQLKQAVADLKAAKEKAEAASAVKSNFLNLVSHEVKTPLTALVLQLELFKKISQQKFSPQEEAMLEKVFNSAYRSVNLMDSLLDFTKLQSEGVPLELVELNLNELVSDILTDFRAQAEEKSIELKVVSDENLPPLKSDYSAVKTILRNIIGNAMKYTEKGLVQITLSADDSAHVVKIKDTGIGIPKEKQKAIFEPFHQLENIREKHKAGFGLGLSIATSLMEKLGGKVEVESEEGKGSLFIVTFPHL